VANGHGMAMVPCAPSGLLEMPQCAASPPRRSAAEVDVLTAARRDTSPSRRDRQEGEFLQATPGQPQRSKLRKERIFQSSPERPSARPAKGQPAQRDTMQFTSLPLIMVEDDDED